MRVFAIAVALLSFPAIAAPPRGPHELTTADARAWLDGFMPHALARDDVAGAVVAIVRGSEVIALEGYGYADAAAGVPVDPERTLFRTGSVGKLFTWTAVMQLVESGKLDLDRDVNQDLDFRIPARAGQPVTLRNLMTHTPGFEEVIKNLVTDDPARHLPIDEYVKAWTPRRIYPPGEIPAYSNYGVTLAGYLVERASGESYDDYVERHVFTPLGMQHSTTRQPLPERLAADMSKGYELGSGTARPFEIFGVVPAGSASTTGADMARFMMAYLQEGAFEGGRILRPETVRRTFGTRLPVIPPLNAMLLGFFEENLNGRRIVGHGGDSQFFHSTLNLLLDEGVGVYLAMNSSGRGDSAAALPRAFMGEFADRYFPSPPEAGGVDAATAAQHAQLMTGTYASSRRQESNFFSLLGFLTQTRVGLAEDGGLRIPGMLDFNGQPMRWREVRPWEWHQVGAKERLAARVENGRVAMWSVDSESPFVVLLRVPWWKSATILLPLAAVAISTLVVAWPLGACVRRHYGIHAVAAGRELAARRCVRAGAIGALAILAGWATLVVRISGDLFTFTSALDPWIFALKASTLAALPAGLVAALWNARFAWVRPGWQAKAWSGLLVLAFATLLWVAAVNRLAGFGTDY